jgi:hypothetical protein
MSGKHPDLANAEDSLRTDPGNRPRAGHARLRIARRHEPRPPVGRAGPADRGARPARTPLRLVHRGLQHRGHEGRRETPLRAGMRRSSSHGCAVSLLNGTRPLSARTWTDTQPILGPRYHPTHSRNGGLRPVVSFATNEKPPVPTGRKQQQDTIEVCPTRMTRA